MVVVGTWLCWVCGLLLLGLAMAGREDEMADFAARFAALRAQAQLPLAGVDYSQDWFGPVTSAYGDIFSRALSVEPETQTPVYPALPGTLLSRNQNTIVLQHTFNTPYPFFHDIQVQHFFTIYNMMVPTSIAVGAAVSQQTKLGTYYPEMGLPFKFELRIGSPFTIEVQATKTDGSNLGFDPAVHWHWLLPLGGNPDPAPSLQLVTTLTGMQEGVIKYKSDVRSVLFNNILFQALDEDEQVVKSAELNLIFRLGYLNPGIDDFNTSTMYIDPISPSAFADYVTETDVTSVYETEIVLPPVLHAGGVKFNLIVTDIWGQAISLVWGGTMSEQCAAWLSNREGKNNTQIPIEEYFDFFSRVWPLRPQDANYAGLTTAFGPRQIMIAANLGYFDFNKGYDIRSVAKRWVVSSISGTVVVIDENHNSTENSSSAEWVMLQHEFCEPRPHFHGQARQYFYTKWANVAGILVKVGDYVAQGQLLAQIGNFETACCKMSSLHVELRVGSPCDLEFALNTPNSFCPNADPADQYDPQVNPWYILPRGPDCQPSLEWIVPPTVGMDAEARYSVSDTCPWLNRLSLITTYTVEQAALIESPCENQPSHKGSKVPSTTRTPPSSSTTAAASTTTIPPTLDPETKLKAGKIKSEVAKEPKSTAKRTKDAKPKRRALTAQSRPRMQGRRSLLHTDAKDAQDGDDLPICVDPDVPDKEKIYISELTTVLDWNWRTGYDPTSQLVLSVPDTSKMWVHPPQQYFSGNGTWFTTIIIPQGEINDNQALSIKAYNIWGDVVTLEDPRKDELYANESRFLKDNLSATIHSKKMWKLTTYLLIVLVVGQFVALIVLILKPWTWNLQTEISQDVEIEGVDDNSKGTAGSKFTPIKAAPADPHEPVISRFNSPSSFQISADADLQDNQFSASPLFARSNSAALAAELIQPGTDPAHFDRHAPEAPIDAPIDPAPTPSLFEIHSRTHLSPNDSKRDWAA
eukprot:g21710.t1